MSLRRVISRALKASIKQNNVVPFPGKAVRRRPRGRKMPPQGNKYDVQSLHRIGLMPWKYEDDVGRVYTKVTYKGKNYMRREDGVYYKPMRTGEWTSLLSPPKGIEAYYKTRQAAKVIAGGAAAGIAANEAFKERR